jgi:hypothetical protein
MMDNPGSTRIEDLPLSASCFNALKWAECETVADLAAHSDAELLRIPNLGWIKVAEMRAIQDRILGTTHDRRSWPMKALRPEQACERDVRALISRYTTRMTDREIREVFDRLMPPVPQ